MSYNFGYKAGKAMEAEMNGEGHARGGKVGQPHIGTRVSIKAPSSMPRAKAPHIPLGLSAAVPPEVGPAAPAGIGAATGLKRGGKVVKVKAHVRMAKGGKVKKMADGGDVDDDGDSDKNVSIGRAAREVKDAFKTIGAMGLAHAQGDPDEASDVLYKHQTIKKIDPSDKMLRGKEKNKMMPGYAKGGAVKKSGIHINPANKGKLHATLGVPAGEKIPAKKLAAAKNSDNPVTRKRAQFAINAKKFKHADGGKVDKADAAQDKKAIAAAVHKHERHDHKGEPLTPLKKGGKVMKGKC